MRKCKYFNSNRSGQISFRDGKPAFSERFSWEKYWKAPFSPPKYSPDHQVGHIFMYNKVVAMILLDGPAPEKWQVLQSLSKVARLITNCIWGAGNIASHQLHFSVKLFHRRLSHNRAIPGASFPGGLAARWPREAKGGREEASSFITKRFVFF